MCRLIHPTPMSGNCMLPNLHSNFNKAGFKFCISSTEFAQRASRLSCPESSVGFGYPFTFFQNPNCLSWGAVMMHWGKEKTSDPGRVFNSHDPASPLLIFLGCFLKLVTLDGYRWNLNIGLTKSVFFFLISGYPWLHYKHFFFGRPWSYVFPVIRNIWLLGFLAPKQG